MKILFLINLASDSAKFDKALCWFNSKLGVHDFNPDYPRLFLKTARASNLDNWISLPPENVSALDWREFVAHVESEFKSQ
jgi:hypothetical protein